MPAGERSEQLARGENRPTAGLVKRQASDLHSKQMSRSEMLEEVVPTVVR
jgi:hypothetical protein